MLNLVRLRVIDTISLVPTDSDFMTIPAGAGTETTDNIIISVLHPVTYDGQDLLYVHEGYSRANRTTFLGGSVGPMTAHR